MKCSDYRPCKQCTKAKITCEDANVRMNRRTHDTNLSEEVPEGGRSILLSYHQETYQHANELERVHRQDRNMNGTLTPVTLAPTENDAARREYPGLGIREDQQFSDRALQDQSPTKFRPDRLQFAVTANSSYHSTPQYGSIQRPALSSIPQLLPAIIAEHLCIAPPVAANSICHPNPLLRSIHLPALSGIPQMLPSIIAAETDPPVPPPVILPSVATILHSASLQGQMQPDARRQLLALNALNSGLLQPFSPPPLRRF